VVRLGARGRSSGLRVLRAGGDVPGQAGRPRHVRQGGWRKYFSLAGPIATFGYWFAWSSVLAIYGGLIGFLLVGEFFTSLNSKGVNTDSIGGWTANVRAWTSPPCG
jgi:hypothetical protein